MLNKRCIDLIKYLIDNNLVISLKEAALYFDVGERSIRYDIENINYYLENKAFSPLKKIEKGKFSTDENLENITKFLEEINSKFYVFTLEERKDYLKSRFIFSNNNKLISIAEDLDISLSTIKVDLKDIKKFFTDNELELNFLSKHGIVIEGNECKIRLLGLNFLLKYTNINIENLESKFLEENKYGPSFIANHIIDNLKNINIQFIKKFIKNTEQKLKVIISDEALNVLTFYLLFSVSRLKNNYSIENFLANSSFLEETKEFSCISSGINFLEESFNIKFSKDELLSLTELFLGSHSYNFNASFFENWIKLETTVVEIIHKMSKELNMNLSEDRILIDGLLNHLKPAYYRIKNNIQLDQEIASQVKKEYPYLYSAVENVTRETLENYLNKDLPEEEISYIVMHFKTARDRYLVSQIKTKNILLVCDLGYGTSKILTHKLSEIYDINIIDTIPYHTFLDYEDFTKVDMIISTTNLNLENTFGLPFVKVHPILSLKDKENLLTFGLREHKKKISLKALYEAINKNCAINNAAELIHDLKEVLKNSFIDDIKIKKELYLKDFLSSKNVNINEKVSTWEESIKLAGSYLFKNGSIKEGYIQDMIDTINKKGAYFIMDNKLAFPHSRTNENVLKTDMCLIHLEKSVVFPGGKEVDTLLCFSSLDQKEHMTALNDFVSLVEHEDIINKMRSSPKEDILSIISR